MLIAGFRHTCRRSELAGGIVEQWQRLKPYFGSISSRMGNATYGVVCSSDEKRAEYMYGIEVADFSGIPPELDQLHITQQIYAVFSHEGSASNTRQTWQMIWDDWYPGSDYQAANSPDLERFDDSFDPTVGTGRVELWFPVTRF